LSKLFKQANEQIDIAYGTTFDQEPEIIRPDQFSCIPL